jgi:transposase
MGGEPVYVGIDAGVAIVAVCALDHLGNVIREQTLPASNDAIMDYLSALDADVVKCGIEAGSTSIRITRHLRQSGYSVSVMEAQHVAAYLKVRQNKSDRNDARGIADALRLGRQSIPEVMVKTEPMQLLRSELVLRNRVMQQRVATENLIRGVLRLNGGSIGRTFSGSHLDRAVREEISRLHSIGIDLEDALLPTLELAVATRKMLERSSRRIERIVSDLPVCRRFLDIPGVGIICALSFYTAIEDPWRFEKNEDVGPYLGLAPRLKQSGSTSRLGRISKRGNTLTRKHIVTAAKSLMQQPKADCDLRRWALILADRAGRGKARVALARKLAIVMLAIWKSDQNFKPFRTVNMVQMPEQ